MHHQFQEIKTDISNKITTLDDKISTLLANHDLQ